MCYTVRVMLLLLFSVTLDRKFDRNCDIGRFELAYKQPIVTVPPYIGINLNVEGQYIRKPPGFNKRTDSNQSQDNSPRREFGKLIINNDKQNVDLGKNQVSSLTITSKRPRSENLENSTMKCTTYSAPAKTQKSITNDIKESFVIKPRKSPAHYRSVHGVTVVSTNGKNNPSDSVKMEECEGSKAGPLSPHPPPSYLKPTFNSSFQNNPYLNTITGRRMVSRTSVNQSYSLPGMDSRERATLAVNNVESTDLRTIKATRGKLDESDYKTPGFPVKPFKYKQRIKRPIQKHHKPLIRSTNHVIRFPRVPYASVSISLTPDDSDTPKFRYFNLSRSSENNLYYTEVKCVDMV